MTLAVLGGVAGVALWTGGRETAPSLRSHERRELAEESAAGARALDRVAESPGRERAGDASGGGEPAQPAEEAELAFRGRTPVGAAVPGMPFEVTIGRESSGVTRRRLRLDFEGEARLGDLAAGEAMDVAVSLDGAEIARWREVVLEPGEVRELVVPFQVGRIAGTIVDEDGEPVASAELWAARLSTGEPIRHLRSRDRKFAQRAFSAEDGSFEFRDVPLGDWLLGPVLWTTRTPCSAVPARVELEASGTVRVEIEASTRAMIRGTVASPDGPLPPRLMVEAKTLEEGDVEGLFHGVTDDAGRFRIGPLPPASYRVRTWGRDPVSESRPVVCRPGDEIILHAPAAAAVVVDLRGPSEALRAASVLLIDGELRLRWATVSDGHRHRRDAVPCGRKTVVAVSDAGWMAWREIDVVAGRVETIELELQEACQVELENTAAEPARVLAWEGDVPIGLVEVERESKLQVHLPRAPVRLEIRRRGELQGTLYHDGLSCDPELSPVIVLP